MSWRYLSGLVAALDHTSVWQAWRRREGHVADAVPVLEGDALEASVRQIR